MKVLTPVLAACLIAGSLALGAATPASADKQQRVAAAGDWRGGAKHRGHRHDGMQRMLRGLDLSEAQRDQIFEIRHAQAPAMRAQMKTLHAARKDLRELALAPQYDAAKARASADALAGATSQLALMRIDTMRKVLAVLTPEQRKTLEERRAKWQARRDARS
ncbi:MAG: Spy/CpxP family protein refolding chaperone [Burkholderiales bacterium]|nr:Spy/CpxP family protein refolding chaperone [Burkholderiales bacterium]